MEVNLTKEQVLNLVEKRGISKADFAKKIGVDRRNLEIYLSSKKKDINLVIKIADALSINLYELLGMQEPEKDVYGCLYVKGVPTIVNNREDIIEILNKM